MPRLPPTRVRCPWCRLTNSVFRATCIDCGAPLHDTDGENDPPPDEIWRMAKDERDRRVDEHKREKTKGKRRPGNGTPAGIRHLNKRKTK